MRASDDHVTQIDHDGFYFYFFCKAGDVRHTDNAFDRLDSAVLAAELHKVPYRQVEGPAAGTR